MPSGQYVIDDTSRSRGDTSFRTCVIALLIFLLFCVTIIIVLLVVKKDTGSGTTTKSEDGGSASKHTGDEAEKEDRSDSEGESKKSTPAAPPSTPKPLAPVDTTEEASTFLSSTEKTASRDASEDRSSSEGKHDKAYSEYSSSTEYSASTGSRKLLVGVGESADFISSSTEISMPVFTESTGFPEMHKSTENGTFSGNITSTSTESSLRTSTDVSAEGSDSETYSIDSSGNLTSTSTESSANASSASLGLRGSLSEYITSTSTESTLRTTTDVSDSETHSIDSSGNLTSTSTEPSASTSSSSVDLRGSPEESVEPSVSTSTEHSSITVEPPIIPTSPPPPVPCTSSECKKLSANILATMGLDADPCKQFYEYACGGLRENKYLSEPDYEEEAWHRINGMVDKINPSSPESYKKFKTLIQSCKTFDPVKDINMWKEAVNKEMKDLGDIAFEDAGFSQNFTRLFLGLLQHDRPFIVEMTLDINDSAPSRFAVKMFPAQMMENQLYPEDNGALECQAKAATKYQNLNDIYHETLNCMNNDIGRTKAYETAKEALLALGIFSAIDDADKLNETLLNYVDFLVLNNEVLEEKAGRRLELLKRDPLLKSVKEVNEMFVESLMVDWSAIIEKLVGRPLNDDERVQVYSARYFMAVGNKYKMRPRHLHNALLVAFAAARYRDLVVEQRWRPRVLPAHCTRLAARLMPDAAAALYLHSFSDARRAQLEAQTGNFLFELTNTFLRELDHAPWLHESATEALRKDLEYKMASIKDTNSTDHTRDVMDTHKLDAALNDYPIDEAGFVNNAVMLMARNRKRLYKRIDEEPINNIWTHFIAPYDTTGITLYSLNFIAIPLGAMEKPFYDPDYLRHLRLAGLGFSVAHEMAHHIDSLGIKFNTSINERTRTDYKDKIPRFYVWKKEVNVEYMNMTGPKKHKIVQFQFDDTELKEMEVFADKIAIQLAYKTYKKKVKKTDTILPYLPLTNDQSFFVFLAQKFCTKMDYFSMVLDFFESPFFPPETRVKNMLEDNAAFYNAFNCSVTYKTDYPFPYIAIPDDDMSGA